MKDYKCGCSFYWKTELSNIESGEIKIKESPVENVDTEEAIYFDDLTVPGDYSDYDILEEEKNNNKELWSLRQN